MAFDFLTHDVVKQKQLSRYRTRHCITEQNARYVVVDGKQYLNFSSNDYLGLNHHPDINQALQEGVDKFGSCASASSLITGYSYAHQALEHDICTWLNKPHCLLYASGFSANQALMQALGKKNTAIYLDKLSHASLIDGALTSDAKVKRFLHNDIKQLSAILDNNRIKTESLTDQLIVSEGVFSMDGDQADCQALAALAQQYQALLYLDDAHSIGVIGEQGAGSASQANVDIVMATFGKAIATSGAFVACDTDLHDYLLNFSRHYIYSTAISPALAWATRKSIALVQTEYWRREKIIALSQRLSEQLDNSIEMTKSQSSIHGIIIGSEADTLMACEKLKQQGIWLTAIRPPTVAANSSRLRVTVTSAHDDNDINYLAKCINEICSK